ncbi:hypothetical protein HDC92_002237 [Pedobacter sp. AK017]|uniref:hypothetical protein n=1 Tax=Pedobacter sp. AK017 TaxID=2723073 RepID=UPI00161144EA|nr:hypothetical protein [Pedobacter sp. AK017]MBB5438561.1 hypothetical protein [Pedobacter sp. AK017]
MLAILKRILALLEIYFEERRAEQQQLKMAALEDNWLDCQTVKLMLRKGDRTLFNYVQNGKLICKKIGGANFYLQSSVMKFLK